MDKAQLYEWFKEIYEDFEDYSVPSPRVIDYAINQVLSFLGTDLKEYLGKGDNGIVFLAEDGDVIKFTIDANEAYLWQRLQGNKEYGIIEVKQVINLASSKTGKSIIFAIKAEYAPYPLSPKERDLVRQTVAKAREVTSKQSSTLKGDRDRRIETRTINFIQAFEDLSDQYPQFLPIPAILIEIADRHKGHLFDLQPDNFRKNGLGQVVIIDPSVPDLFGDLPDVQQIFYEHKLQILNSIKTIFI